MKTSKLPSVLGLLMLGSGLAACAEEIEVPEFEEAQGQGVEAVHAYPPGPFGIGLKSVIPNLKFHGFHNPQLQATTQELIELAEFYNPTGTDTFPSDGAYKPGQPKPKVLWIVVSAQWCGPCK